MNRKLFILLVLFLALAAALFWQLMRNAEGDDPTTLESALIGKPLPEFRLEALNTPGQTLGPTDGLTASRCCSTSGPHGVQPVAPSISFSTARRSRAVVGMN